MKGWFQRQPIHRKLVVTSVLKTTAVLTLAMVALLALDAWRFQRTAEQDADSLAKVVAAVVLPAVALDDPRAAAPALQLLSLRPQVEFACVYGPEGQLFSQYQRDGETRCPPTVPRRSSTWHVLDALTPIRREGQVIGHVYVARDWQVLIDRLQAAGLASLIVLILAAGVMLVLSNRLHRAISIPIRQLADATAEISRTGVYYVPPISASQDEVGQLVDSVEAMVGRVQVVTHDLTRINDTLRFEIEERQMIEREREEVLRREREANRIKDEFLATVSHELRTPLNAIVGWAQVLSSTTPDSKTVAKAAASLQRNAEAQARVIDDLIDISRIVTGKLRVDLEPVDLREAVEGSVEAIRPAAEHAGVTLTMALPDEACVIRGDLQRLQQVVWNLLSNAVKFARRGQVRVEVRKENGFLFLIVSDKGQGISPEFLPMIFDRFRQADSTVTREHGGLGIGLAVVKELVELQGGTIQASSDGPGTGATFSVRFPCAEIELPGKDTIDAAPTLRGVSILAVDDNPDSLEVLEQLLTDAGATVRTATSGARSLELWQRRPSDVLLCDIAMPYMSGYELLARIRELDRLSGRVTPAIAVTAHVTDDQVARSARAGFQLHISKPISRVQLIKAIDRARLSV
jgi:signal transduction histidine kinase/CheY-like chemotaxis protein